MRTLALVVCLMGAACERSGGIVFDPAELGTALEKRLETTIDGPLVTSALDATLDAIGSSPHVATVAGALFARLSAEPEIATATAALLEQLGAQHEMQALIGELARTHPDASEEQVGALVEQHVERAFEAPEIQRHWDRVTERLVARVRDAPAAPALIARIKTALELSHLDAEINRKWSARLTTLAAERPTRARASALWHEHFWRAQRVDKLLVEVLETPAFREATAKMMGAILAHEKLAHVMITGVKALLADAKATDAVLALFRGALAPTPDQARMTTAIDALLAKPAVLDALSTAVAIVAQDPAFARIAQTWLDEVRADRSLRAAFERFWFAW